MCMSCAWAGHEQSLAACVFIKEGHIASTQSFCSQQVASTAVTGRPILRSTCLLHNQKRQHNHPVEVSQSQTKIFHLWQIGPTKRQWQWQRHDHGQVFWNSKLAVTDLWPPRVGRLWAFMISRHFKGGYLIIMPFSGEHLVEVYFENRPGWSLRREKWIWQMNRKLEKTLLSQIRCSKEYSFSLQSLIVLLFKWVMTLLLVLLDLYNPPIENWRVLPIRRNSIPPGYPV